MDGRGKEKGGKEIEKDGKEKRERTLEWKEGKKRMNGKFI